MLLLQVVNVIEIVTVIAILSYASFQDVKTHTVSAVPIAVALCIEAAAGLMQRGLSQVIIALIPGVLILLLSFFKGAGIGAGDGLIAMITGISLGIEAELISLYFSFILSSIFALLIIALKKGNKRTEIPFVPFMAAGFLIEKAVIL